LHESRNERGAGPLELSKHILPKWVYQKLETWNIDKKAIKTQLPKKVDGGQSSIV
jgi:hypothetical protein